MYETRLNFYFTTSEANIVFWLLVTFNITIDMHPDCMYVTKCKELWRYFSIFCYFKIPLQILYFYSITCIW